jgi:DNA-binding transcriptional ArsR family regulator
MEPAADPGSKLVESVPSDVLATYLKAMAHPKRVHLLGFLTQPHHIEEIASELGVARQTAQEHVQQLYEAGLLVKLEGKGERKPVVDYLVAPARLFHVYEMVGQLSQVRPDADESKVARNATEALGGPARSQRGPEDPDLPRLTVVHGLRIGQTLTLHGDGPWMLGREPTSAIDLDYDPYASQRHAEIRRAPAGGFVVADLYSTNGTFLEWRPLARGGVSRIENGSLLRVGKTLLLFRRA